MKNIFLIDRSCKLIKSVSKSTKINIHTMIVENEQQKEDLKLNYNVENIYTAETINDTCNDYKCSLDYNILEQYRHTQVKVENFFNRFISDVNFVQYIYINALLFWNDYFEKNNIDMIVLNGVEHGFSFDSIVLDVAVKHGVKVYVIETALENGNNLYTGMILDYTSKVYVPLEVKKISLENIELDQYLYYKVTNKNPPKVKSFKNAIRYLLDKLGGELLVMFAYVLIGKYKNFHFGISINWSTYFRNFLHVKKMLRFYSSVSVEFDSSKKYVFYALHMEPEAATQARATFSNQLIIIKTIAQNLPDGWELYVKEHPHQLKNLNNRNRYYYLAGIKKFRTKETYRDILRIPNVKLLDINTKSKSIIESSQAVSSINGTIVLEGIVSKKPILLFSQSTTPFQNLNDIFHVKSEEDVVIAMNKIQNQLKVNYDDLNGLISEYFFKVDRTKTTDYKDLFENLVLRNIND